LVAQVSKSMPPKLILIIEDDFRIAGLVAEVLGEAGYGSRLVSDMGGARAFEQEGGRPDGIISDLVVEGGGEPARLPTEIDALFPGVPLTLMTGVPPNRRLQLGVIHHRVLEKPFELSGLLDAVAAMVGPPVASAEEAGGEA
jgi:DNA-binding NtrC family response regulator